ncbi:hypothetical protein DV515_00007384 [Chloebia gouldiae]|uniref:Uncharacterized protein n=1 Tax=Chloebia gouldiae TaxID=44316 RepID=A0A3L8SIQ5_CHLGU|nr:hypothetical protein DV515_00007384 [Chloebia gouldiae]
MLLGHEHRDRHIAGPCCYGHCWILLKRERSLPAEAGGVGWSVRARSARMRAGALSFLLLLMCRNLPWRRRIHALRSTDALDQEAAAVRPRSVTGLAPLAQSRHGQSPATELLSSGAR